MTTADLQAELTNDPLTLGYQAKIAAGDLGSVLSLLNTPNAGYQKEDDNVPVWTVLAWAAAGPMAAITDASNSSNAGIRAIALASLKMFEGSQVFFNEAGQNLTMIDALLSAGVITSDQKNSLLALRMSSPATRAEVLWGPGAAVRLEDLWAAVGTHDLVAPPEN